MIPMSSCPAKDAKIDFNYNDDASFDGDLIELATASSTNLDSQRAKPRSGIGPPALLHQR